MAGRVKTAASVFGKNTGKKRGSIARRWLINSMIVVILLLLIFNISFLMVSRSLAYQSASANLHLRAATYNRQIDRYREDNADFQLESSARQLVEQFTDKEKVELQIINQAGRLLTSSTGFVPSETAMPDYKEALTSAEATAVWEGANGNGEHVMATTTVLSNETGTVIGALRYVVSLELVDRQIWMTMLAVMAISVVIAGVVLLSNIVFIRSVLRPIKSIGVAARRIALGDYEASLRKTHDDEIGDLCDTINYMAGEIADTERLKNEFISSVSHELRTPLTAIKGWSETMQMALTDTELTEQGLRVITGEAERLSGMVEELLDFSRMQNGHMQIKFERTDLVAELEEVLVFFRDRAEKEGVTIKYIRVEQPLPPVLGDRDRLRQVFINVIDNAIKYSAKDAMVRIEAADMGDSVQVVISDNGIGISPEDLLKVKTKFYRANNNRPGSGIGLALAEEIVLRHNGTLEIDSELDVGTTVTVTLPIAPSERLQRNLG